MEKQYKNTNEWLADAREAAISMNPGDAHRHSLLWKKFIGQPIDFPQQEPQLEGLRQNLLVAAFPVLSPERASDVLRVLTKQFFIESQYHLSAFEKIEDRINAAGEGLYEEERLLLKNALETSETLIQGKKVGVWLSLFDTFKIEAMSPEKKLGEFLLRNSNDERTDRREQQILKDILNVYAAYLQNPIITIADYENYLENGVSSREASAISEFEQSMTTGLTILKALSKFPNIGNQILTESRIKIKSSAEPVRGSLTNWLKVYRDELGIGRHDAVTRAKFLFESVNTKGLSSVERENIHAVIRSLEDDELLTINTSTGEIIFSSKGQNSESTNIPRFNKEAKEEAPKDLFERFDPQQGGSVQQPSQPAIPIAQKPANTLPTPLQNVGTGQFGPVSAPVEKNKETEKALLERIQKMKNHPMPEPHLHQDTSTQMPSPFAGVPGEPVGKLTFSGPQVFSGEKELVKMPFSVTELQKGEPIAQKGVPRVNMSPETRVKSVPMQARPLVVKPNSAVTKKVTPSANVFHIRPNRDE